MSPESGVPALAPIGELAAQALNETYARLPALAAAVLIALAGWLAAVIVRWIVRRISRNANRLLDRIFERRARTGVRASQSAIMLLGEFAFWLTLIVAIALAAQVAGFVAVAGWLGALVAHLPNLIAGAAIIVIGFVLSIVIGEQVAGAAENAGTRQADLIGKLAQGAIFAAALIIGLDQIGVDVTLLVALAVVVTSTILLGFAIALGMGAREFVSDVISARALRRDLRPGMSIRIGALEGEVLEITATHIAIDTPQGKALAPARLAAAEAIVILDSLAAPEAGDA